MIRAYDTIEVKCRCGHTLVVPVLGAYADRPPSAYTTRDVKCYRCGNTLKIPCRPPITTWREFEEKERDMGDDQIRHYEGCKNHTIIFNSGVPVRCLGCDSTNVKVQKEPEPIFYLSRNLLARLRAMGRADGGKWVWNHNAGDCKIFGHRYKIIDVGEIKPCDQ